MKIVRKITRMGARALKIIPDFPRSKGRERQVVSAPDSDDGLRHRCSGFVSVDIFLVMAFLSRLPYVTKSMMIVDATID